jgi:chemotaxis protein CheX
MINIDSVFEHLKESTALVIESMSGVKPVPGKVMPSAKNELVGYVSGNVGITGEMKISITVSFSQEALTRIYSSVFPDESEEVTIFQMGDLVGEVTNMINGNMRRYLAEESMKFDSSIPTVVVGSQQIYHPQGTIAKVIPFDLEGDFIFLEVGIKAF